MITIKHILKDGTEVPDIAGRVIKADEFPVLYEVVNRIQKEGDTNAIVSASD
jgi:hypothetical protein